MPEHNELPASLPVVLSGQLQQIVAGNDRLPHDISINGIPFLVAPSGDDPYVRDWQDGIKDQFDSSREAGENSFGDWWLRSQATFHGGQGQKYLDSSTSAVSRARYFESRYAYPHTPGELTIGGTPQISATQLSQVEQITWSAVPKIAFGSTITNAVHVFDLPGMTGEQIITLGVSGTPAAMTSDGENLYVAIADAVWRIEAGGTAIQTHSISFVGPVTMGFAKDRLILCTGPEVYELDPDPATVPVSPSPFFTNPSTGYAYTAVADGPNGIYLAGHAGPKSDLSLMQVSESGGTVTMGLPVVQLAMPPAEIIHAVFFYVSSFFVLATSSGARVGSFTPYAQPQMGPPTIDGTSCYSATGAGNLLWVGGVNGSIWWIDLSTPIDDAGRYAHSLYADGLGDSADDWINDLTILPASVAGGSDLVYATTNDNGITYQTSYVADQPATITTSWSRFDTVEPKQLHYVRVSGNFPVVPGVTNVATVRVESDAGGAAEFNIEGGKPTYEFSTAALAPAHAFRLVITLRDTGSGNGVALHSYQLKALPTPRRFAEYVLPLRCFDLETSSDGREFGYQGFAKDRLAALEAYADSSATVTVRDRVADDAFQAVIRRMQYRQTNAPPGLGGAVSIIMRRV